MKQPLDYKTADPKPKSEEEKPIVAAAIVFMPIIGALLIVIFYALRHM